MTTVTAQQAADAQTALRKAMGLDPERFPQPAFIAMISDEIEQLRGRGKTDQDIVEVLRSAVGVEVSAEDPAARLKNLTFALRLALNANILPLLNPGRVVFSCPKSFRDSCRSRRFWHRWQQLSR